MTDEPEAAGQFSPVLAHTLLNSLSVVSVTLTAVQDRWDSLTPDRRRVLLVAALQEGERATALLEDVAHTASASKHDLV
jgi:hypothetical protein